jgi:hypothetical protein
MGKERPPVAFDQAPREQLLKHFRVAVVAFEQHLPDSELYASAEVLFEKRKRCLSVLRREELSDEEFVKDWITAAAIPPYNAFEIGVALGEMIAAEKDSGTSIKKDD